MMFHTEQLLGLFYFLYIYIYIYIYISDISQWIMNDIPKANTGKCHILLSPYEAQTITVGNYIIKSSGVEEL